MPTSRPQPLEPARFRAYVGLGANLGPARQTLHTALSRMAELPSTCLEGVSPLYVSKPVDAQGPDYLNAVAALETALAPGELLRALLNIETGLGRERPHPNAPRLIDLDLLWMEAATRSDAALSLPHPRLFERAFVLEPLAALMQGLAQKASDPVLPDAGRRLKLAAAQGISLESPPDSQ